MLKRSSNNKKNRKTMLINNPMFKDRKRSPVNYEEIYRNLRANIEYSQVENPIHSITITSSTQGEGKSTTAANLAIIFASKYEKVLLVDCDLRRPVQHSYLGLSNKKGLTNALVQYSRTNSVDDDCFQKYSDPSFVNDLTVLTTGVKVPNPSEMVSSVVFKKLVEDLKKEFDFIIFDCPPILMVSDAIPIGNVSDGTIMVCSSANTKRKDAATAVGILQKNNVNVLGTVLTQTDVETNGYYHYY